MDIDVLRRNGKVVAIINNEVVPVTNMYDMFGEECQSFDLAVSVVAGPTQDGKWVSIELEAPIGSIH